MLTTVTIPQTVNPVRSFWRLIFGVWGILSLFMSSQLYAHLPKSLEGIAWYVIFLFEALYCIQWVALVPLSLWLAKKFPLNKKKILLTIPVHIAAGIILSMFTMAVRSVLNWAILQQMRQPLTTDFILSYITTALDYGVMSYLLNSLFAYSFEYYNRLRERELVAAQLETELGKAQLQALKMQLHPHFFFNTLNTISMLIRKQDNDLAVEMISRLSKFLRYTLDKSGVQEVTLKEELETIDLYLHIQQARFNDKLTIKRNFDPATMNAFVPALILQPLVENALIHGISKRESAGILELNTHRENGTLHINIIDDGNGINSSWRNLPEQGIGLQNTESRLSTLYGNSGILDLHTQNGHGTVAHVVIPYHEQALPVNE